MKSISVLKRPPLDLGARLAVCDANYLRLLKLVPQFSEGLERTVLLPGVSEAASAQQQLQLQVTENFRYTTTLKLTLTIAEPAPSWYQEPHLTVRLYHDAGTAEVISYQDHSSFKAVYGDDDAPRFNWDEKNQINLFLADWLSLCLEGGMATLLMPQCLQPQQIGVVTATPLSP